MDLMFVLAFVWCLEGKTGPDNISHNRNSSNSIRDRDKDSSSSTYSRDLLPR